MSYESAMVKLAEVIVGVGGQASIAFSSIDQRYRHLQVRIQARGDVAAGSTQLRVQLNGDTGANYDRQFIEAYGATADGQESLTQTSAAIGYVTGASGSAAAAASATVLELVNYVGTTFRKAWTSQSQADIADSTGAKVATLFVGNWRSTAAITSILLFPSSGNFVQGSVASLYGII